MKFLRNLSLILILFSIIIFNWNCNDEKNLSVNNAEETLFDGPTEKASLWVHEYCHITPIDGEPYDAYLQIKLSTHNFIPYGYTYDSFITPDNDRTIDGIRYQTINFRITKSANWKCRSNNCAARFNIAGVLSEDIFFSGTCTSTCTTPPLYCGSYFDEDIVNLPELTNYSMFVGADCIVGDEWEIGD